MGLAGMRMPYWSATDAELKSHFSASQRAQLAELDKLVRKFERLHEAGEDAEALPIAMQVAEIEKELFGESHPEYATGLNNLALLYARKGDYARAKLLFSQCTDIYRQAALERTIHDTPEA